MKLINCFKIKEFVESVLEIVYLANLKFQLIIKQHTTKLLMNSEINFVFVKEFCITEINDRKAD